MKRTDQVSESGFHKSKNRYFSTKLLSLNGGGQSKRIVLDKFDPNYSKNDLKDLSKTKGSSFKTFLEFQNDKDIGGRMLLMSNRPVNKVSFLKNSKSKAHRRISSNKEPSKIKLATKDCSRREDNLYFNDYFDMPVKKKEKIKTTAVLVKKYKKLPKLVSGVYFRSPKEEGLFAKAKKKELGKRHSGTFMKSKYKKKSRSLQITKDPIFFDHHHARPTTIELMKAKENESLVKRKVSKFVYLPEKATNPVKDVDSYFDCCIENGLDINKKDHEFEEFKQNIMYQIYKDSFDKKESKFCRNMVKVKEREFNVEEHGKMDQPADLVLDFEVAQSIQINSVAEIKILTSALDTMADFIVSFGRKKLNKDKKVKLVDIMMKHPEVFKMDSIYMHRKRLDKEPEYAITDEKRQQRFIERGKTIKLKFLQQKSRKMILSKMEDINKEIKAVEKIKHELEFKNTTVSKSYAKKQKDEFENMKSLGNSTFGITKNAKFTSHSLLALYKDLVKIKHS